MVTVHDLRMLPSSSGEPAPKRQRVAQNDGPEKMAMCWVQPSTAPGLHQNTSASLSSSQLGQHHLAELLRVSTNPDAANPWTMPNSFQQWPWYNDQLCSQYHVLPEVFDPLPSYEAPTNFDVPSVASFSSDASMAFMYPLEHSLSVAQMMSSTTLQVSNMSNVTPVNNQDILVDQVEPTISHGYEISQDPVAAATLAPPTIHPDETVCFGVVSRLWFLFTGVEIDTSIGV